MTTFRFNPQNYGAWCSDFLTTEDLPSLGPGSPERSMTDRLAKLSVDQLFQDSSITDREMATCCLAGIWLWFNYLDESHRLSQRVSSTSGSFWHGIMHRREPDYSNAKYWFRRVGEHPIYDALAIGAAELICESADLDISDVLDHDSAWDAFRFVDLCQRCEGTASGKELLCRKIARLEWQLLFDHCYRQATGR